MRDVTDLKLVAICGALCMAACISGRVSADAAEPAGEERPTGLLDSEKDNALHADVIVLGTIERLECVPLAGTTDAVTSDAVMSVETWVKGGLADTIRFRVPQWPPAVGASYKAGERAVVFLNWYGSGGTRELRGMWDEDKYLVTDAGVGWWKGKSPEWFLGELREFLAGRAPAELLERAEIVALGEVTSKEVRVEERLRLPPERRTVFVTLLVSEPIKGCSAGDTLTVIPPVHQGEIWDYAIFEPGERVLVFLRRFQDEYHEVLGGHDGKHTLGDFTTDHVLREIGYFD